jgi:hypothetical protein
MEQSGKQAIGIGSSRLPVGGYACTVRKLQLGTGFFGGSLDYHALSLADGASYQIIFGQFLKYGLLMTLVLLGISTLYLWLRYLS